MKSFADYNDAPALRQALDELISQMIQTGVFKPADLTGIAKKDIQIPTRDGASIRAIHYRSESGPDGPLLVHFHGGGFVVGYAEGYEAGFEILTKELGFTVVSVDYRMAPEHVFPTAATDSIDAVHWVSSTAEPTPESG
jgi:acetyl esterase/lipase